MIKRTLLIGQVAGSQSMFCAIALGEKPPRRTKLFALMLNAAHDDEHYGNLVTYMRLNKMVPPTSRPAPK